MTLKPIHAIVTAAMMVPVGAVAAEASGRYATHNGQEIAQELADGSTMLVSHYTQITFADDRSHPLDNVSSDCVGRFHTAADGALISGDGMCSGVDPDGNSASFWWRVEKAGTADCPDLCGAWGYFNGTGRYQGIEGSGTWVRDTLFHNGSSGTWKGDAKLK